MLAFDEKCLVRAINIDSGPQFSIWASLPRAYENIRRGDFRVYYVCINFPVFFLYPRFFILWSSGFPAHAPVNWKQIKKSQKNSMKTSEFRFLKASLLRPTNSLFSIANIHSHSSTKTASWHELAKFSYPKPILWLRKVDFEKLGPILSSHISADAPFHAEFEFVLAFEEKCLVPPIINDY